ncbi:MAG: hypothetical protein JNL69_11775 [Bacteroidia bacterium]|nr:hypothetical protein [Bacteroidia bacterium]
MKNLSYKKKNQLLLLIAVSMMLIIYNFAIKRTIEVIKSVNAGSEQLEIASNAPQAAEQLKKELKLIDSKIGTLNPKELNNEQALLELVTEYCQSQKAILREFPKTTIHEQGELIIETNNFLVQGNFNTLLNLVYILEQKSKLGKISSVKYQLKKDFKSKEMILTASIYIQKIKKKSNE